MNLHRILKSMPIFLGRRKSESRAIHKLLERSFFSQIRPIASTKLTTNERQDAFRLLNTERKYEPWTVRSRVFRKRSTKMCINGIYHVENILQIDCRSLDNALRHFTTATQHLLAKKAQKSKSKAKKLSLNEDEAEGIVDLKNLKQRMEDVLEELSQELAAKVPLRITSGFLDNIMIDTGKGKKIPLYELAQVKTHSDSFSIEIQDNFPNAAKTISSAISETGFNMQPTIKGSTITLPIPQFPHDQRGALEKIAKGIANQIKDALRKVRQKGMVDIRNNKEGQSKDLIRRIENQVQQLTDFYSEKVELVYEKKVKEINK